MRKIVSGFITTALIICIFAISYAEQADKWGNINYTINNSVLTLSGNGEMKEGYDNGQVYPWTDSSSRIKTLIIEEGITSIAANAFHYFSSLENVSLPSSLRSIGVWAFCSCYNLHHVEFPEGLLNIDKWAFYAAGNMDVLEIPSTVEKVAVSAFDGVEVKKIIVRNGNKKYVSENNAFMTADRKELIKIGTELKGEYIIPEKVEIIDGDCFTGSEIEILTVPKTVKEIFNYAFAHGGFKRINLECSKAKIGQGAFSGCKELKEVYIIEGIKELSEYMFQDCTSLNTVILPASLNKISGHAFEHCPALKSISLPKGLKSFDDTSFDHTITLICAEKSTAVKLAQKCEYKYEISTNNTLTKETASVNENDGTTYTRKKGIIRSGSSVNVRSEPSKDASKVSSVKGDAVVEVLSESNGWYEIQLSDGITGWISGKLITIQ